MLLDVSRYAKENAMSAEAMQAMLDRQGEWFHSFAFSNGCKTNGRDLSARKLDALGLPDLTGKSVIDVGAFEGFFSFQAERLGAKRVVACDHFVWTWPDSNARSNFEIVRDITSSRIEDLTLPVEDLSPDKAGTYDITLFMGVLYHAPDMVGYLRNMKSVTNELVVIETLVDALHIEEPVATFYPPASLNNDSSNWWGRISHAFWGCCVASVFRPRGSNRFGTATPSIRSVAVPPLMRNTRRSRADAPYFTHTSDRSSLCRKPVALNSQAHAALWRGSRIRGAPMNA
jgi:tRNA (mo5U34)-methyltransferase